MTFTSEKTYPSEYVAIVRLANYYMAIHCQPKENVLISNSPETDIKLAEATAKIFAQMKNIPYDDTLHTPTRTIITVLNKNSGWFPAELHPDEMTLIKSFRHIIFPSTKEQAINMAKEIASLKRLECIPSIGISLYNNSYENLLDRINAT